MVLRKEDGSLLDRTVNVLRGRQALLLDSLGIALSTGGFGLVCGLAAHDAGFSVADMIAMSTLVYAGAAQFAAIGYVKAHTAWATICLLTFLLNARHLLYSASLAPRLTTTSRVRRALMAHFLTDETFALCVTRSLGDAALDLPGYWIAALVSTFIPFNLGTLAGTLVGAAIPSPDRFGLDVVFPAAMGALCVGLLTSRREVIAAATSAAIAVVGALFVSPMFGIVAGGVIGPAIGFLAPGGDPNEAAAASRRRMRESARWRIGK